MELEVPLSVSQYISIMPLCTLATPDSHQVQPNDDVARPVVAVCRACAVRCLSVLLPHRSQLVASVQFSSVEIATWFGMAAHLLRQNLLLPSPTPQMTLHDARTQLRRMPPAYSTAQTPFSRDKDFALQLRYQLESTGYKPAKLRPCKVIFVGDCAVGKTAIVNR